MYTDRRVIPLLQEIETAGANGRVRFLTGIFEIPVSVHAQLKCLIVLLTSRKITEILFPMKSIVMAVFWPEAQIMLFLHMRTKEIVKT